MLTGGSIFLQPLSPPARNAAYSLAQAFLELCDDHEPTAYWLYAAFVSRFHVLQKDAKQLSDTTATALTSLLKSHQKSLADHLTKLNVDLAVVCQSWLQTLYAGVLPPDCLTGYIGPFLLIAIWQFIYSTHPKTSIYDVLIGGAPAILAYVGLSLLLACRRKLETAKNVKEVEEIIVKVGSD